MDDYKILAAFPQGYSVPLGYEAAIHKGDQGGKAVLWLGSLVLATNLLTGTTAYAITESAKAPSAEIRVWTNSGVVGISPRARSAIAAHLRQTPSLRDSVLLLRDLSGLTWDQLGKLLGVSRRAMHLWASGGHMNSYHAERLRRVIVVINGIDASTSSERREALLASGPNGRTIYEDLLSDMGKTLGINGPMLPPEQLVGALHDQAN